ncbi:hypothetical protein OMP38_23610 [Cohnella ginsengisoli]|uniref:Uncharacterized protein n=1 Tax=Cohnella ginsengisoli TaxID=425004 RepID=A0A9X4KKL3_9BACL|nr:hypothetical protein [Cohnella ginsengisoli]MDG0793486.1 hypothetical protein [Cohnella ginsengisoli]
MFTHIIHEYCFFYCSADPLDAAVRDGSRLIEQALQEFAGICETVQVLDATARCLIDCMKKDRFARLREAVFLYIRPFRARALDLIGLALARIANSASHGS